MELNFFQDQRCRNKRQLIKSSLWSKNKTSIRREVLLQRQRQTRQAFFDKLSTRLLSMAMDVEEASVCALGKEDKKKKRDLHEKKVKNKKRTMTKPQRHYQSLGDQLVIPDLLVDIPPHLATEWLVYRRPEGIRVVLTTYRGRCYAFTKSGACLGSFCSGLPRDGCTILDAVLCSPVPATDVGYKSPGWKSNVLVYKAQNAQSDPTSTSHRSAFDDQKVPVTLPSEAFFAVTDALSWSECSLVDLPAECRRFMLQSKFEDLQHVLDTSSPINTYPIRLVPTLEATPENLDDLYFARANILEDTRLESLIFVNKEALLLPGLSPLYLCWKDQYLSRYFVDTTDGVSIETKQRSNIWLRMEDGALLTEDNIKIAKMDVDTIAETLNSAGIATGSLETSSTKPPKKLLIRVEFDTLNLAPETTQPSNAVDKNIETLDKKNTNNREPDLLVNFKIIGKPSFRRRNGESLNRIIHQFMMRENLKPRDSFHKNASPFISFQDIKECAALGCPNYSMMLLRGTDHLENFWEGLSCSEDDACSMGSNTYEEDLI